jgi:hypothetical protein
MREEDMGMDSLCKVGETIERKRPMISQSWSTATKRSIFIWE